MTLRPLPRLLVGTAIVAVGWFAAPVASAQETDGPTASLDRLEASPGQPVVVRMDGFGSGDVTIAVCGNLAKRGSADCDMRTAQGDGVHANEVESVTQLIVQPPPAPCPCIVRVSSNTNDEFAVAPLVVLGHPVAPVVAPSNQPLVDVTVEAEKVPKGFLATIRSALGGPTRYEVTVSVRNRTTETLSNVQLAGSARHRLDDFVATLELAPPGPIGPGQTYTTRVEAEVPAPAMGRFSWTVSASGAGSTVAQTQHVNATPLALFVLLAVLLVDIAAIVGRRIRTRRRGFEAVGAEEVIGLDLRDEIDLRDQSHAGEPVGETVLIGTGARED